MKQKSTSLSLVPDAAAQAQTASDEVYHASRKLEQARVQHDQNVGEEDLAEKAAHAAGVARAVATEKRRKSEEYCKQLAADLVHACMVSHSTPAPERTASLPSQPGPNYTDSVAQVAGLKDASEHRRLEFIRSLPGNVGAAIMKDEAGLAECLRLLSAGAHTSAIGHAFAVAAKSEGPVAS